MSLEYWYVFPYAVFVCVFATSTGFSGAVLFQPFFYFFLNVPVHQSIATGIATETVGMSGGAYRYAKMKYHDYASFKWLLPFSLVGVLVGYGIFHFFSHVNLKRLVGMVMILVSLIQFYSLGKSHENKPSVLKKWSWLTFISGIFSSSTGTGVAELNQPLLEHAGKLPTKKANATAILLEASSDWLITLLNLSIGNIRYDILIFSVSGVLVGSQIGPRLAPLLPDKWLKMIFAIGVGGIGIFYLYQTYKS